MTSGYNTQSKFSQRKHSRMSSAIINAAEAIKGNATQEECEKGS